MFKNLIIYTIGGEVPPSSLLDEALSGARFMPCGKTQPVSSGWVPPRDEHGAYIESVGGQWIARMQTETKILPAEVIKRRVSEMADKIEDATGRKPGKRQRKELADEAMLELLPQAFTRRVQITAWIDPVRRLLMVDASSGPRADLVAGSLVSLWPRMNLHALRVNRYVDATMGAWMLDEAPPLLTVDRDAVLESAADDHTVVRYQRYALDSRDVIGHLQNGKVPTKLALTYNARVSFVLVDDLRIQKIEIADGAFMEMSASHNRADEFDADVAITTGELRPLIEYLIDELGGVAVLPVEKVAQGDEESAPDDDEPDPLYTQACTLVRAEQKVSISQVQRCLRIGYNRAARLIEAMEADGLVTPMQRDGSRQVIAPNDVAASAPAAPKGRRTRKAAEAVE